jgi:hypothetical protein
VRVLHFLRNEVGWECRLKRTCECEAWGARRDPRLKANLATNVGTSSEGRGYPAVGAEKADKEKLMPIGRRCSVSKFDEDDGAGPKSQSISSESHARNFRKLIQEYSQRSLMFCTGLAPGVCGHGKKVTTTDRR